ncbi:response regulator transcription factor [Sulfurimonas lithotrophica]|uniref:Response regulator transcription factor n=1 Tax=Sulfurimonas lithotrophica TaxID=2590022 RepID=A0A5P8NYS5_9BACT|nr:response regulator transcription factor [Sulfurimonas lithotrophica]QFR48593.1 response regulator transcription factor [Sulfurimonas lithotrophica]
MKKKLLLLEDDIALNETVVDYFENLDYEIVSVFSGNDALDAIYENNFDLLLLDVNVPDINGFEILKTIRKQDNTTPAIFITSLNSMADLESGYESGCDDYIRKPFALKELKLRVESILKREFFHISDTKVEVDSNIYYDTSNDILNIDGKEIQLNNKDAKLLKLFLQNKEKTLTHETIYDTLWDYDEEVSESALRTYIKNLRKLLGKEKIVSIKKLGYRFTSK